MSFKDLFATFQCLDVNDKYLLRQVNPEKDFDDFYEIYSDTEVFNKDSQQPYNRV